MPAQVAIRPTRGMRPLIHRPAAASSNGPVGGRMSALSNALSQPTSSKCAYPDQLTFVRRACKCLAGMA